MEDQHRHVLRLKSSDIAKTVSLEKLEPHLLEYKMFNKYMWHDIKSVSDLFNELPFRGPKAFQNIIEILRKAKYDEEADCLENELLCRKLPAGELYYRMTSRPLGYCLIINNVKFETFEERVGSNVDADLLKCFFKKIDYDVAVESNKKAAEMYNCLEKFSRSNFRHVDSAIVIILSHGGQYKNKDVIYGTDENWIFKDHIIEMFSNKNCELLQGKPKIFFFVACRGDTKDYGVPRFYPSESTDSTDMTDSLASCTDVFVVHSSLPNHPSMRDHEKGTWFCQDLLSVLEEYYDKYDIETIIKIVNNKLVKRISIIYRIKQVAHTENIGGMKQFMLSGTCN